MINTYQSSLHPPPVPPRLGRDGQVLISAPQGHSRSLLRFLVGVVLVHLLLSVGGFTYLYLNQRQDKIPSAEGKVALLSSVKHSAMASMVVKQFAQSPDKLLRSGYMQWNMRHSALSNIDYYHNQWLTVRQPGDYYVYSRVTFSGWNRKEPLASAVHLRESASGNHKAVMTSYCSRERDSAGPCTASQGQVISLKQGNQLSVWVQNLSMVSYEEEVTSFGLFKL